MILDNIITATASMFAPTASPSVVPYQTQYWGYAWSNLTGNNTWTNLSSFNALTFVGALTQIVNDQLGYLGIGIILFALGFSMMARSGTWFMATILLAITLPIFSQYMLGSWIDGVIVAAVFGIVSVLFITYKRFKEQ